MVKSLNKFIGFVFLVVNLSFVTTHAENWQQLKTTSDSFTAYVDVDSIKKNGNEVETILKINTTINDKKVSRKIVRLIFCERNAYVIKDTQTFEGHDFSGREIKSNRAQSNEEKTPIPTDIKNIACPDLRPKNTNNESLNPISSIQATAAQKPKASENKPSSTASILVKLESSIEKDNLGILGKLGKTCFLTFSATPIKPDKYIDDLILTAEIFDKDNQKLDYRSGSSGKKIFSAEFGAKQKTVIELAQISKDGKRMPVSCNDIQKISNIQLLSVWKTMGKGFEGSEFSFESTVPNIQFDFIANEYNKALQQEIREIRAKDKERADNDAKAQEKFNAPYVANPNKKYSVVFYCNDQYNVGQDWSLGMTLMPLLVQNDISSFSGAITSPQISKYCGQRPGQTTTAKIVSESKIKLIGYDPATDYLLVKINQSTTLGVIAR